MTMGQPVDTRPDSQRPAVATTATGGRLRVAMLGLYPEDPARVMGGVEAVVSVLAAELATAADLEIHVVSGRPGLAAIERETHGPVTVHRVPEPRLGRLFLYRPARRWLQRALHTIRPGVVHAHGSGVYVAAAIACSIPAVVTLHGVVAQEARLAAAGSSLGVRGRWTYDRLYERYCLARVRELIVISPYLLREFPQLARQAHVTHIENPIDASFFQVRRAPQASTIFCPARIIARKGILDLIQAFAQLQAGFPPAELRLAGETTAEPDYARRCQAAAQQAGVADRVHFLGPLSRAAVQEELATCTLVALAAHQETAPVSLAEAMAAACPVVATTAGGVPDLIETRKTGLLVAPGDVPGLAAQMHMVLRDTMLATALGHNAQRAARARFHPQAVAARTRAVYQRLAASA